MRIIYYALGILFLALAGWILATDYGLSGTSLTRGKLYGVFLGIFAWLSFSVGRKESGK